MLFFVNDYGEGAHPKILQRLSETNFEHLSGYGTDPYTESARKKILSACHAPDGQVFLLVGGTQTNETVISAYLRTYEGVVACETGHVAVHEAGAIEHSGHKVLTIPGHNGKMNPEELDDYLASYYADGNHEHMVFPGMVYISYPTEYGSLYTKAELTAIHQICQNYHLPLFIDGARLGYGLTSDVSDMTLPEIAALADVFYIGGTKAGALCGEAVVFPRTAPAHFFTHVKQHGALLAKGRLLGIQFDTLFTDDLYFKISRHAIDMAMKLKKVFTDRGYPLLTDSPTNQQFVILSRAQMDAIGKYAQFEIWEPHGDDFAVRFATSWATREEDVDALAKVLDTIG